MSKKRSQTWCIVIDASIAFAAGPRGSPNPRNPRSRDFLWAIRAVCHRMAWSQAIKAEWDRRQSRLSAGWLASMEKLKKLRTVEGFSSDELREAIRRHSDDVNVVTKMLEDVHLIEAAIATAWRIASLDENARGHFARLAADFDSLRKLVWVNPAIEEEEAVEWLHAGAPNERSRRLKP